MNISEPTIKSVQEFNGRLFYMNRVFDTAMSTLGVDFVCPTATGLMHEYMAHFFPSFADKVNDNCLEKFNVKTYYPATPAGDWEWNTLVEMMEFLLKEVIDTQNLMMGLIAVSDNNNDYLVSVELYSLLREFNSVVAQMILIRDKAVQYGSDYTSFDHHFPSFFFLDKE